MKGKQNVVGATSAESDIGLVYMLRFLSYLQNGPEA